MTIQPRPAAQAPRQVWSAGDYGRISPLTLEPARMLVRELRIGSGDRVLDVGTGDGNVALLAARRGAIVTASDITRRLLEQGRARARRAGLELDWVEADVRELPFDDGEFDVVTSAFGAIFAPRPHVAARELVRVLRPGGRLGMLAWTPEGMIGRTFAISARHLPPADGAPSPVLWGMERVVSDRLCPWLAELSTTRRTATWTAASADGLGRLFATYGPTQVAARDMLPERRYRRMEAEFLDAIRSFERRVVSVDGAGAGRAGSLSQFEAEYLVITGRR